MKSPSRVERGPKRKAWASLLLLTVHTAHQLSPAVYYLMLLQFQLLIQAWSSNIQNELHVYLCASLLVFFLVFHLLTLAYLVAWLKCRSNFQCSLSMELGKKKKSLFANRSVELMQPFILQTSTFCLKPTQADILCMAQSSTCLLHCLRCCMKNSWALTWSENCCQSHCTVPSVGQHFPSCCVLCFYVF